jgi:putative glutamine amidotransferase
VDTLGAVPLLIPPIGSRLDLNALLDRVDGVFIPGGLTNVHPSRYGRPATEQDGPFDQARDATTLPLIRAVLARGTPLFMTCRGLQELNVAFGGTLRREPDELPEEKKHGTPESATSDDERYRLRQPLRVRPGGRLAAILGSDRVLVNSLHSHLVDDLAPGLVVEATADDGSVEAVSVRDAKGFALAVIFHPEYWTRTDDVSRRILFAFRSAIRDHAAHRSLARSAAE